MISRPFPQEQCWQQLQRAEPSMHSSTPRATRLHFPPLPAPVVFPTPQSSFPTPRPASRDPAIPLPAIRRSRSRFRSAHIFPLLHPIPSTYLTIQTFVPTSGYPVHTLCITTRITTCPKIPDLRFPIHPRSTKLAGRKRGEGVAGLRRIVGMGGV